MSKTDGIGTWVWNNDLSSITFEISYEVSGTSEYSFDFVCDGVNYVGVSFIASKTGVLVYSLVGWDGGENSPYRTIDIKTAPPAGFLTILQANAVYQEPKLTDLTGTTWKWNSYLNFLEGVTFGIDFYSNDKVFDTIIMESGYIRYVSNNVEEWAYDIDISSWLNEAYRLISITGGTDATNTDLINYLYANAELQGSAPVIDKYKLIDQNGNLIEINSIKKGIVVYQDKEYEFDNN